MHIETVIPRIFILISIVLIVAASVARAHDVMHVSDWINKKGLVDPKGAGLCCGENDCTPIPSNGIELRNGGYYLVETRETISSERVIWQSDDGRWWRCAPKDSIGNRSHTRCLIGPPQSL
jgi:hypothetical protein